MASPWEEARAKQKISAPKESKYHGYQGQAGGIGSTSSSSRKDYYQDPVERMRGKYFDNREDISRDRLERRLAQQQEYDLFKLTQMKPVSGASNLYQSRTPGGPTLADKAQELAMKYGPTPKEIMGDIGYGASKMLQGYGIPFVSTATKIGSAVSDAWNKIRDYFGTGSQTQAQGIETQFPQPTSDMKDSFSSMGIDTGVASIDPNNMLAQIAKDKQYENIPFQDLLANASVQAGDRPVLPPNVVPKTIVVEPTPKEMNLYKTPVLPPEVTDPRVYEGQRLYAENTLPNSVMNLYDIARNPQLTTDYGNLRLDNVLSGNPQLNYGNTVMINGVPVNLSASIGQSGLSGGLSFNFNKGGSVDKYSGLGYMFK